MGLYRLHTNDDTRTQLVRALQLSNGTISSVSQWKYSRTYSDSLINFVAELEHLPLSRFFTAGDIGAPQLSDFVQR